MADLVPFLSAEVDSSPRGSSWHRQSRFTGLLRGPQSPVKSVDGRQPSACMVQPAGRACSRNACAKLLPSNIRKRASFLELACGERAEPPEPPNMCESMRVGVSRTYNSLRHRGKALCLDNNRPSCSPCIRILSPPLQLCTPLYHPLSPLLRRTHSL